MPIGTLLLLLVIPVGAAIVLSKRVSGSVRRYWFSTLGVCVGALLVFILAVVTAPGETRRPLVLSIALVGFPIAFSALVARVAPARTPRLVTGTLVFVAYSAAAVAAVIIGVAYGLVLE